MNNQAQGKPHLPTAMGFQNCIFTSHPTDSGTYLLVYLFVHLPGEHELELAVAWTVVWNAEEDASTPDLRLPLHRNGGEKIF